MRRALSDILGLLPRRHRLAASSDDARAAQMGQVLPLFVLMSVVLLGGAALLTDVASWWTFEQRMQRAADAGALAGAVYLPGNPALAYSTAKSEASKNGFTDGLDSVVVAPRRDPADPRKLIVDIDGQIHTNFAQVFCWEGGPCLRSVDVDVTGAAKFVLPVPMGSPQNYYGVGLLVDAVTTTTTAERDTDWNSESAFVSGAWTGPGNAATNNDSYATTTTNGDKQEWRGFGLLADIPDDPSVVIQGLQVRLTDVFLTGSATSCRVGVEVSPDNGSSWSTPALETPDLPTTSSNDVVLGRDSSTADWGPRTWVRGDFDDAKFRVRLTRVGTATGCPATQTLRLDQLEVRVDYKVDTISTTIKETDVRSPAGTVLAPQGFWGALQSQGAPNIQGDAYMTYYDTRTSRTNRDYQPDSYYQYAIEMPPGSSGGEVWLFDPGFCHVDSNKGTGEYYTLGGTNGSSAFNQVSTFYDLFDTRNTLYDSSDDRLVYSSGAAYRQTKWYDTRLNLSSPQTSATPCDGLTWHNKWVRIASGLSGNMTYRLHTYSTDPSATTGQLNATALNAFAIWSTASGGTPRVYGLGSMEAYVRLPGGRATEFYLARIAAEHAGKTMVIKLWDPGDTGALAANLQILRPDAGGYAVTPFDYSAAANSGNASSCGSRRGSAATSVTTNTGNNSLFNGCWLTLEIALPSDYSAPHPSTDSVTSEGGWWKIRYNMSGSASDFATDLTTWEVELRGNPVHLVME